MRNKDKKKMKPMTVSRPRFIALALAAITLVSGAGGLAGCSLVSSGPLDCDFEVPNQDFETSMRDVVVVLSPTTSFVRFDKVLDASAGLVGDALGLDGARISVVVADGRPAVARTLMAPKADTNEGTEVLNRRALKNLGDVYTCTRGLSDSETINGIELQDEVDMLDALDVAARSFDPSSSPANRRIVILGNGLDTAGQYNFAAKGIPREVVIGDAVASLEAARALPDLRGVSVSFVGLGLVNDESLPLNPQSRKALEIYWRTVIEASGGRLEVGLGEIEARTPEEGSIKVSEVEGLAPACIDESLTEADGIMFQPALAVFIDTATATAKATEIANKINQSNCDGAITVIGYVASAVNQSEFDPNDAGNRELSQLRAEAFKSLLIGAGVTVPINVVGGGKGPVNEWDANGTYKEDLGKQNRKVVVTQ